MTRMIFRNYVSYVELHGILSQFWAIFAFHIDSLGKPKFDIDQIDRPVLAGQFLVQLAGQFLMQFNSLLSNDPPTSSSRAISPLCFVAQHYPGI
jgi:hypothetical protein